MPKAIEFFVPGRLCLFGEHSDWAGGHRRQNSNLEKGYAIIIPTNQGNSTIIKRIPEKVLRFINSNGKKFEIEFNEKKLLEKAETGDYMSYIAGVVKEIISNYDLPAFGIEINNYKTNLPIKKGLSSSASICVLIARAFNLIYNLHWTKRREMEIAYLGEITTPSRCGRLDQACAYGCPVLMTFDADKINIQELKITKPIYLVIVDLKSRKNTKKILADLNKGFPFPASDSEIKKAEYLGELNKSIVLRAKQFLKQGKPKELGKLMIEAQRKFNQHVAPACPEELTAPKLRKLLDCKPIQNLIYGGKGVGSQGDGSAQFIAKNQDAQQKPIKNLNLNLELNVTSIPLIISVC